MANRKSKTVKQFIDQIIEREITSYYGPVELREQKEQIFKVYKAEANLDDVSDEDADVIKRTSVTRTKEVDLDMFDGPISAAITKLQELQKEGWDTLDSSDVYNDFVLTASKTGTETQEEAESRVWDQISNIVDVFAINIRNKKRQEDEKTKIKRQIAALQQQLASLG